jgi:hypothetical protein
VQRSSRPAPPRSGSGRLGEHLVPVLRR